MEPYEITRLGMPAPSEHRLSPAVGDGQRAHRLPPHAGYNLADSVFRTKRFLSKERELDEKARDFLAIFKLEGIQDELAKNLPYGEQRRLEIARALACNPSLLLLDEPAAGMNPREIVQLMELIHFIRDRFKLTILLIEHQMRVVMGICERITVMDFGEVIARGTPRDIQSDARSSKPTSARRRPCCSVENLNVYYGAIHALQGISFHVEPGEIVTLIGANGAGKSTTLRSVSGLLRPRTGSIRFKDEEITATSAERIVELGISQVPEGRKIFSPLTVRENLMMGAYTRTDAQAVQKSLERVFQSFPRLKERIAQLGGTLSGGEQQMLATARV
jgi:ABC-type branched-subunit amino acid transport system ATPase component